MNASPVPAPHDGGIGRGDPPAIRRRDRLPSKMAYQCAPLSVVLKIPPEAAPWRSYTFGSRAARQHGDQTIPDRPDIQKPERRQGGPVPERAGAAIDPRHARRGDQAEKRRCNVIDVLHSGEARPPRSPHLVRFLHAVREARLKCSSVVEA